MSSANDSASDESSAGEAGGRVAALPAAPAEGHSRIGRSLAGCTIESLLGAGPLASTFRARREADERAVAIKLLHESLREDENVKRRFGRDLESARKLEHIHIAQVYDHGVDESEGPFVCRELVDGQDLLSASRAGPLTPRRVCELLMQVLSALAEAHRNGVLHRNLKPQNVLVRRDQTGREWVKVCDFGDPLRAREATEYKAPEQADKREIDGRADVYAVGVMLYELLTDEAPFRGASAAETLALHKSARLIPPREKRPDRALPRELEAVCVKALAKEPSDRYRSPREMSQALRAVVALLGLRAEEPLGSRTFSEGGGTAAHSASFDRMTVPGEQLRSRTKFWLGAALLAAVCIAVLLPAGQRSAKDSLPSPLRVTEDIGAGGRALESGMKRLRAGDPEGAVIELRGARRALGDTPEVLRALGEALVIQGSRSEGTALLSRYLELEPDARDRAFVQSLVQLGEQQR